MRTALRLIFLVPGWLLVAASLLGFAGRLWWGFDLLSSFRLQYLVGLAVIGGLVLLAGGRRSAWVLIAVAGVNAALLAPLYLGSQAPPAGDERIEIVSVNTQLSNPRQQMDWIMEGDPDVVLLFESSRLAEGVLPELAPDYTLTSAIEPGRQYGLSVLTRDEIDVETLAFAGSGGDAVRLALSLGDETVTVLGIHPPSPSNPYRTPLRDRFLRLAGETAAAVDGPVVVAGDFNTTPWSHGFRLLAGPGDLRNSQAGFGYGGTWPANLVPLLRIPLDHLLHSEDLTVVTREIGPDIGSDHLPLRVVLARSR